ncbi:MAG TPA: DEAD/DEAH box helicase [Mobilitalea sp.]|nr:DEAD/DEAH box helicase [Mobilitalea sp.]
MQFKELNVIPAIRKALEKENYEVPTPIQEEAIPIILSGRDLLGCAQTGTGKTAAFAIPTLQLLSEENVPQTAERKIRALIVTPTRELALQIYESFRTYGRYTNLKYCVIFGGVSQKPQEKILQQGVDILVATPGRLNDLINQKRIDLKDVKIFILDEADRMLDMGFINDIKKLLAKVPANKQTLLFSATMPPDIAKLSDNLLKNPAKIEITPVSSTVDTIEQYLYYVDKINKKDLLLHILKDKTIESALVFTRTKHGADRIVRQLAKEKVTAQAIHGDKSQGARQSALSNFKNKKLRILIATDIAARGIDIDELSHVINYDLPNIPETYVHRIGRTGRAGLGGVAISFCDFDEKEQLADIENLIGKQLKVVEYHPYPLMNNFPAEKTTQPRRGASWAATSQTTETRTPASRTPASRTATSRTAASRIAGTRTSASQHDLSENTSIKSSSSSSPKKASTQKVSQHTASKSEEASKKKKYRMTADGTLKEKRSNMKFSKKFKRETDNVKNKNY